MDKFERGVSFMGNSPQNEIFLPSVNSFLSGRPKQSRQLVNVQDALKGLRFSKSVLMSRKDQELSGLGFWAVGEMDPTQVCSQTFFFEKQLHRVLTKGEDAQETCGAHVRAVTVMQ